MISQEDIKLLQILKKKFDSAGQKYGTAVFDKKQLEQRIQMILAAKGNIKLFLLEEVRFIENAIKKAKNKIKMREGNIQTNSAINQIIEKNEKNIKRYPDSFFDPSASYEMRYLVGGISQFYQRFFSTACSTFKGTHDWIILSELFFELEKFYFMKKETSKTAMLSKYIDELNLSKSLSQKDIINARYLQTAGLCLYKLNLCLSDLLENFSESTKTQILPVSNKISEWKNQSYGVFLKMGIQSSKQILRDFRLINLVSYQNKIL